MERRDFITSACRLCLLGTAGYLLPQVIACSPSRYAVYKTSITNNQVEIPLALFDKNPLQLVRPKGLYYDIAVEKKENNTWSALLLKCTHQENQLTPKSAGFECSLHGSQFDEEGKVTKGPAEMPLKKYQTSVNQNNLVIHLH